MPAISVLGASYITISSETETELDGLRCALVFELPGTISNRVWDSGPAYPRLVVTRASLILRARLFEDAEAYDANDYAAEWTGYGDDLATMSFDDLLSEVDPRGALTGVCTRHSRNLLASPRTTPPTAPGNLA